MDGVLAEKKKVKTLNSEKIAEEKECYDGFYAVYTTLEDDIETILRNQQAPLEIGESFRIMKSEFHSRPVYLRRERTHQSTLSDLLYRTAGISST